MTAVLPHHDVVSQLRATRAQQAEHVGHLSPDALERLAQMRELSLFSGIRTEELAPLAEAAETVTFEPDQYVVRQGDPGDSIYIITHGRIEVLASIVRDGIATESAVASLSDGDALGELSLLDGQARSASCVAAIPTTCVRLGRDALRGAMMRHWPLAEQVMITLTARIRHADKVMAEHARDPLTGVYNRRALYEIYDRESRRAQRAARRAAHLSHDQIMTHSTLENGAAVAAEVVPPVSLLFIDVNKFKTINDTYGHKTGDDVLIAVARALTACARATDHVARYGGDEFVVILPDGGESGARHVTERVKSLLADDPPGPVPFSISIGAAVVDQLEPPTLEALMARADEEMYRDKERQR